MTEPRKEPYFSTVRIEGHGNKDFLQKQSASGEATPLDPAVFKEGSIIQDQLLPHEIAQTNFTTFSLFESDEGLTDLRDNVAFSERRSFNSRISNEAFINPNRILPYERKYTEDKGFASSIPREGLERNDCIREFEAPHEEIPFQRTFIPQTSARDEFQQSDGMQVSERLSSCRMTSDIPVIQDAFLEQLACNKFSSFATPGFGERFIEQGQHSACNKLGPFVTPSFGEGFIEEGQHSACHKLGQFATSGFGEEFSEHGQLSKFNKLGPFVPPAFGDGFIEQGQESACNKLGPYPTLDFCEGFIELDKQLEYDKLGAYCTPGFGEGFIEEGQLSANMTIEAERPQLSVTQSDVDFLSDPNFQFEATLVKTKQRNPPLESEVILNQSHVRLHGLKHTEEKPLTPIVGKEGIIVNDNLQYQVEKAYGKLKSTLCLQGSAQQVPQQHEMTYATGEQFASRAFNEVFVHQSDAQQGKMVGDAEKQIVSTEDNVGLMPQDHLLHLRSALLQEGQFSCFSCSQRFRGKILLQEHEEIHKVKKSFICNICCTFFAENADFLRHYMTHKWQRPFPRTECYKGFSTKRRLLQRQSTHTGEYSYKCDLCDYASVRSGNLQRHMRTHTGERPHKCDLCDYASAHSSDLRKHRQKHTGEFSYKCDMCDYACAYSSVWKRHRRLHQKRQSSSREISMD